MLKNISALLLAGLIAMTGCRKKEDNTNTDVTFNNHISKQIELAIYPSFESYAAGTNPTLRKVINGGDKLVLPGSTFASGQTYYMDWYTNDRYYNNWYNDNYPQSGTQVAFKPAPGNTTYYIDEHFNGNSRNVFLSTNDVTSRWHAVNAYLYSNSTGYVSQWSALAEYEKYRIMTVNKNFTAQYEYKTSVTQNVTDNLNFKVMPSADAYILFMSSTGLELGSMSTGKLPTGTPPNYVSTAKDTVMALLPNSDMYFMMVRE